MRVRSGLSMTGRLEAGISLRAHSAAGAMYRPRPALRMAETAKINRAGVPPRFVLVGSGLFVPRLCDGLMAEENRVDLAKSGTGQGTNGSWR